MPVSDRRAFLRGASLGLLGFTVAGSTVWLTPRQARAADAELKVLSLAEAETLERAGAVLAPGAAEAGIAWYIDQQLSVAPNDSLLMAKYFNVAPPYAGFYQACVAELERISQARYDQAFVDLDDDTTEGLFGALLAGEADDWRGPPAFLAYLVLRNDAVDVVYGTRPGIESLGVPYMAHIEPPAPW